MRYLSVILALVMALSLLCGCAKEEPLFNWETDSKYNLTAAMTADPMKELCEDYFRFGFGLTGNGIENAAVNSPEYMAIVKHHANSVTLTNLMKPTYLLQQEASIKAAKKNADAEPVVSFESADPTLEWCYENGMQMRGHTLVWHNQTPDWFFRVGYESDGEYVDYETMKLRLESYIKQVVTYIQEEYPGVIYCWDVVNEAVDPWNTVEGSEWCVRASDGNGNDNQWYKIMGEDFVELAYTYARQYCDPEIKLFYNDFNIYQSQKRTAVYTMCEMLVEKGLLDGIGMQDCWGDTFPSIAEIEMLINTFAQLDIEIHISELSISVDNLAKSNLELQAQRYTEIFELLQKLDTAGGGEANITAVTIFGLMDGFVFYDFDRTTYALFDTDFQPKPCFYSIQEVMMLYYW